MFPKISSLPCSFETSGPNPLFVPETLKNQVIGSPVCSARFKIYRQNPWFNPHLLKFLSKIPGSYPNLKKLGQILVIVKFYQIKIQRGSAEFNTLEFQPMWWHMPPKNTIFQEMLKKGHDGAKNGKKKLPLVAKISNTGKKWIK